MPKGTVKWFDPKKGFGFVTNQDGEDVFVHYTEIVAEGFRALRNGQSVEYKEEKTEKGLFARQVKLIESREQMDEDSRQE